MRTIEWTCAVGPDWKWLSGSEKHPAFRDKGDDVRRGSITLPPNPDYWYPCVAVTLNGNLEGNAYLRYFQDGGVDQVQAITVAQGQWQENGNVDAKVSQTRAGGGINLVAQLA